MSASRYSFHASLLTMGAVLVASCTHETPLSGPEGAIEISVAPLSLPGVADACYGLEVLNESGQRVWEKSSICADGFGDGSSAITFVGACDAADDGDGDTLAEAVVVLRLLGLYSANGPHGPSDPSQLSEYRNPCAPPYNTDGCRQTVVCNENADTQVTFNLTVMREANQGFFDIGVNFSDIFCSAKVDCALAGNPAQDLKLVFDPATGQRVSTVVLAFACTDGDEPTSTGTTTHLYADDVNLHCGTQVYTVSPSAGPGNVYPGGVGAPDPIVQAMVFEGVETVQNNGVNADKRYWNLALGLDSSFFAPSSGTAPTCYLRTRLAASSGPLAGATTPNQIYPVIDIDVQLNNGNTRVCGHHPLDGSGANAGVETAYTQVLPDGSGYATETFCHAGVPAGTGGTDIDTIGTVGCSGALCASNPCGNNAFCQDVVGGFECECGPGYEGNPLTGCSCAASNSACQTCSVEIIDFEARTEGDPVNTNYLTQGVTFSIENKTDRLPVAAVAGGSSAFAFNGSSIDTPMPSGNVGLTARKQADNEDNNDIQMAFTTQVEDLRLYVVDIDADETVTVDVYLGANQVGQVTKASGDSGTGNGISTEFSYPGLTIDRAVVRRRRITTSTIPGFAVDYISFKRCSSQTTSSSEAYILMQESAPNAGDFAQNILGTVRPYMSTASPSALYSYGTPAGSSYNGAIVSAVPERSHIFLTQSSAGLTLMVVHDKPSNLDGGRAMTSYTWSGVTGTPIVSVQDDPIDLEGGAPMGAAISGNVVTAGHDWGSCCSDGYAVSGLDGALEFTGGFTQTATGLTSWQFYSGEGGVYSLSLTSGRRIRLARVTTP